jgi:cyclic pyranopterin phosphate synthase
MEPKFTHTTSTGKARMVDVSHKRSSKRRATAFCLVRTTATPEALTPTEGGVEPMLAARLAGIMAAKRTSDLIPLCHPLQLGSIDVELQWVHEGIEISATIAAVDRTGVEMEALTACATAALSVIGSLMNVDPSAQINDLVLLSKSGGKSGPWGRVVDAPSAQQ